MSPAFGFCLLLETVARAKKRREIVACKGKVYQHRGDKHAARGSRGHPDVFARMENAVNSHLFVFLISRTAAPGDVMSAVFCINRNIWKVNSDNC